MGSLSGRWDWCKTLAGPKDEGEEREHSDSGNVHSRRTTKETCRNSLDTTGRCNAPSPGVWGDHTALPYTKYTMPVNPILSALHDENIWIAVKFSYVKRLIIEV